MFCILSSGASQVLPGPACHRKLCDWRLNGSCVVLPSSSAVWVPSPFPLLWLLFGGHCGPVGPMCLTAGRFPTPILSSLPPSLCCRRLPCTRSSLHADLLWFFSDQGSTSLFALTSAGCQCPGARQALPAARGLRWVANRHLGDKPNRKGAA